MNKKVNRGNTIYKNRKNVFKKKTQKCVETKKQVKQIQKIKKANLSTY